MIVEFKIGNFWSFREIQTLQLQAERIKSKYSEVGEGNILYVDDQLSLLKSKAIFGANGSGKSNLIRAWRSMMGILQNNLKDERTLEKYVVPFLLDASTVHQPSFFQIIFVLNDVRYRYGFKADRKEISTEWLYGKPLRKDPGAVKTRERYYFTREGMEVQINKAHFEESARLKMENQSSLRKETLFLSLASSFNDPVASGITQYFREHLRVFPFLDAAELSTEAIKALGNPGFKVHLLQLLRIIDPTIEGIEEAASASDFSEKRATKELSETNLLQSREVKIIRHQKDEKGNITRTISFGLSSREAEGIKKMLALSPYLFESLKTGGAIFVDEFDIHFHPRLTRKIVTLFHHSETNPNGAQLIFATHDTNFLDVKLLRRDQAAFLKKDESGASELYSLADFKGVRNDASFEKDYLRGKYLAVPNLSLLEEPIVEYIKPNREKILPDPPSLSPVLFWDTNPDTIRWEEKAAYVISKVVMYGTLDDWNEIKAYYGLKHIKKEMMKVRYLDPKSLHFLSLIFDVPKENFRCYSLMQSQRPPWNS